MDLTGEQDLVARARVGDKTAFEALLRPLLGSAVRLATAMLQDRAEAEDVVGLDADRFAVAYTALRAGERRYPSPRGC